MPSAKKAGQESVAAFITEWSAWGQSVATQRWMARKWLCSFFFNLYYSCITTESIIVIAEEGE